MVVGLEKSYGQKSLRNVFQLHQEFHNTSYWIQISWQMWGCSRSVPLTWSHRAFIGVINVGYCKVKVEWKELEIKKSIFCNHRKLISL